MKGCAKMNPYVVAVLIILILLGTFIGVIAMYIKSNINSKQQRELISNQAYNLMSKNGYQVTESIDALLIDEVHKVWTDSGVSISKNSTTYTLASNLKDRYLAKFKKMQNAKTTSSQTWSNEYAEKSQTYRERPKVEYSKVKAAPNDYVVFDLETTGLDHIENDILEIGAIKYNNGVETNRFHTYVRINKTIPDRITAINGISNETIKDAPLIRSALKHFVDFIEDYTLVAFNSDFDMSFIQYNCQQRLKKTIDNDVIDALSLAREYMPQLPNKKLATIKKYFELDIGSHNAIDDCIVTNHLYQYCRQFEEIKYRYIIPFPYNARELSDKEVEYINKVVEICEKNGIKRKNLYMCQKNNLLVVTTNSQTVISLKLYGKLQYALFDIPLSNFDAQCQTAIKHTESVKSEGNGTRVFVDSPEQLWEFEQLIVKKHKVWTTT